MLYCVFVSIKEEGVGFARVLSIPTIPVWPATHIRVLYVWPAQRGQTLCGFGPFPRWPVR